MKPLKIFLMALAVLAAAAFGFVYAGIFNVAADKPHWGFTYRVVETVRDRSIAARARNVSAPPLDYASMARRSAGNYDSMCVGCHLAPGMEDTELTRGLYPKPSNLAEHGLRRSPEQTFWIIKHGIKASGMPAWGKSIEDRYIWDMVVFLRKLPSMTAEQYQAEVVASGGHSHGGGETPGQHSHDESDAAGTTHGADHHHSEQTSLQDGSKSPQESPNPAKESKPHVHTHADGRSHVHQ